MKTFTITIGILFWLIAATIGVAQEVNPDLEKLLQAKERVIEIEKSALKDEVEAINLRLDKKEITVAEADALKQVAAEKRALNIENRVAIIDNKIALLQRNGNLSKDLEIGDYENKPGSEKGKDRSLLAIHYYGDEIIYDHRTTSALVFAFGLNNAIIEGASLNDSPYKTGRSRFAEIGVSFSTRVFKESNWLRFKYGVSFQFNGFNADDDLFQVDTGAETELQPFGQSLDKSKFRMDNLVVPVFFEFGPSKKTEKEDYFRYSTYKKFKMGLGGYAGLNIGTRQKLKYDSDEGRIKEKIRANFNTNDFIYGLAGYVGYSDMSLYLKYDLNPIFNTSNDEQRNISLGLRWDWD